MKERKQILYENGICFKCCGMKSHLARNCPESVRCDVCKSNKHPTALHHDISKLSVPSEALPHGGEKLPEVKN